MHFIQFKNQIINFIFVIPFFILSPSISLAGDSSINSNQLVLEGEIIKPDGNPISGSVKFSIEIRSPDANNCLLWKEQQTLDLSNKNGQYVLYLGNSSNRIDSNNYSFTKIFTNTQIFTVGTCTYTPTNFDTRKITLSFDDGSGVQTISAQEIGAVPFAQQANYINGFGVSELVKISTSTSTDNKTLSSEDFTGLLNLLNGTTTSYVKPNEVQTFAKTSLPICSGGQVLTTNGTTLTCISDSTGNNPADASYSGKGIVQFDTDSATSGISVTTGVARVNTGTSPFQIVKLDAISRLPAVDGSQLTNVAASTATTAITANSATTATTAITATNFSGSLSGDITGTQGATVVSKIQNYLVDATSVAGGILKWDTTLSKWKGFNFPACSSSESPYFNSPSDSIVCQSIQIQKTQISDLNTSPLIAYPGTAPSPGISFLSNINSGIFSPSSNQLAFSTNSIERIRIDASGKVGIGTSSPSAPLDIKSTSSDSFINLYTSVNTKQAYLQLTTDTASGSPSKYWQIYTYPNNYTVDSNLANDFGISYNNGVAWYDALTVDSNTNNITLGSSNSKVGIGTGTSTPSFQLHIKSSSITSGITLENSTSSYFQLYMGASNTFLIRSPSAKFIYYTNNGNLELPADLVVNGAIRTNASEYNSSSTIDFSTGNIQHTTLSCGPFVLHNLQDGGSYTFIVKGPSAGTCSFTAYSDAGSTPLTLHMPSDHSMVSASTHTLYSLIVSGSDLYVTWKPGY